MANVFGDHIPGLPYRPIGELFALYRDRDRAKTAIVDVDSGSAVTFGELDRITTAIARLLKSRGVAKGSRVLLLSDENLEKLLLWFGIWRLGAVVCPLNIEINAKVLADLVTVVNPVLVLWHKEFDVEALVGDCRPPRIRFGAYAATGDTDPQDEMFSCLSKHDAADLPERNDPEDIACIFCTSGTTSRPKIVVNDHCAYWLNGLSTLEFLSLTENDRTLEYRSFGWTSAQVLSLMPFLEKGLTLHIARRFSHSRFFDWIQQYGITFAAGVPTVLNMLLNKPPPSRERGRLARIEEGKSGRDARAPTEEGRDFPTLRLMSCSTAPLTAGGFLGDGGTIEPIRPNRIKPGPPAIEDPDGFLRIPGRIKDLIIRGGVNIAPAEIDEVLLKHSGILEAAAVGVPDKIYGEEVVCYVVAKLGSDLTEASVSRHCEAFLPPPKMPKQIFIVADLPKSDRGKVLRDRLREDWTARAKVSV